jgi:hypothetical protein
MSFTSRSFHMLLFHSIYTSLDIRNSVLRTRSKCIFCCGLSLRAPFPSPSLSVTEPYVSLMRDINVETFHVEHAPLKLIVCETQLRDISTELTLSAAVAVNWHHWYNLDRYCNQNTRHSPSANNRKWTQWNYFSKSCIEDVVSNITSITDWDSTPLMNFKTCDSVWVWNLVSDIKGGT